MVDSMNAISPAGQLSGKGTMEWDDRNFAILTKVIGGGSFKGVSVQIESKDEFSVLFSDQGLDALRETKDLVLPAQRCEADCCRERSVWRLTLQNPRQFVISPYGEAIDVRIRVEFDKSGTTCWLTFGLVSTTDREKEESLWELHFRLSGHEVEIWDLKSGRTFERDLYLHDEPVVLGFQDSIGRRGIFFLRRKLEGGSHLWAFGIMFVKERCLRGG